jgi:hypothetical protein
MPPRRQLRQAGRPHRHGGGILGMGSRFHGAIKDHRDTPHCVETRKLTGH